jgi:hypothetical protein
MFNAKYMLNNTAGTSGSPVFYEGSFFEKLNDEEPIGIAWQTMFCEMNDDFDNTCIDLIVNGDPLLVYPSRVSSNTGPKVFSDLKSQVVI